MDNEIKYEYEDNNGEYNVPILLLFEYEGLTGKITILNQAEKHHQHYIEYNGRTYEVTSASCMEICNDTLFLKGDSDYDQREVYQLANYQAVKKWENILKERRDLYTIVHSREEAETYKIKEVEGGDKVNFTINEEPSDEEIEKMISLVDLSTFCKIVQNRLKLEMSGHFRDRHATARMEDLGTITNKWAKDYLVRWAKAKYKFYKIFGDKLSIEKEVEHIPTDNDARTLKETLKANYPIYAPILNNISDKIVKENNMGAGSYSESFNCIKDVNKMTFTKFMSLYKNKELDTEISKLYQANGKTNLTISINPIDYLTVSINKCGWESCHNFLRGCYGTAGLALMFDKTSLVGFSSRGMIDYNDYYKKFTWNNKMWREMIYVSEDNSAMTFSRQYPFTDERFSSELRKLMEEVYSTYFNTSNQWKIVTKKLTYMKVLSKNALLYNDVTSGYDFKQIINKNDNATELKTCTIGSEVEYLSENKYLERGDENIW